MSAIVFWHRPRPTVSVRPGIFGGETDPRSRVALSTGGSSARLAVWDIGNRESGIGISPHPTARNPILARPYRGSIAFNLPPNLIERYLHPDSMAGAVNAPGADLRYSASRLAASGWRVFYKLYKSIPQAGGADALPRWNGSGMSRGAIVGCDRLQFSRDL